MRKFWLTVLVLFSLATEALPVMAEDGSFSPAAPVAAAPSAPKQTPVVTVAPATPAPEAPAAPVPDTTTSFFWLFLRNATVVSVLAGAVIRGESAIQSKTKIDIANGVGIAHTIFNVLRDKGVIAHGNVTDALDQFWNELDRQSLDHLGVKPNALIQDTAHATFSRMMKEHLDKTPVANAAAKVVNAAPLPLQRTPPPVPQS